MRFKRATCARVRHTRSELFARRVTGRSAGYQKIPALASRLFKRSRPEE